MSEPTEISSTRESAFGLVRWIVLVLLAGAALAVAMTLVARSVTLKSPVAESAIDAGSGFPAPDFRLPALDGGQLGPPDFPGQVVVIDFWASWCGPCRLQARFIEELSAELAGAAGEQVQFLAVNVAEDEPTVSAFVAETPFSYPVLLDTDGTLSDRYPIHGLPTVMVISKEGAITYLHVGITDKSTLRKKLVQAGLEI